MPDELSEGQKLENIALRFPTPAKECYRDIVKIHQQAGATDIIADAPSQTLMSRFRGDALTDLDEEEGDSDDEGEQEVLINTGKRSC